ncbi:hypothetical protein RchiOBHm_Chr1g0362111 [Rosa chinensis]|uniref:Uncharacterized protein n=2 Tax=Rosa chinensis TaxID=74649 RepID=A0A2P6SJ45_ROSCH|nr:hypothetical protein RchiOBHm_Chr1g0362111 [Rosa chinensis]
MEFEAQIAYSAMSELDLPVPAQGSMLVWILVQWAIIVRSSKLPFLQPKAEFDRLIGVWCQTSYKVHTQQQANGRLQ